MALFLTAVAVSAAVAWIVSALSDPQRLTYADSGWLGEQPRILGYWHGYRSPGRCVKVYSRFGSKLRAGPDWVIDAQGWPLPSLCAKYTALSQPRWNVHQAVPIGDKPKGGSSQPTPQYWALGSWRAPPVLALRPAWPGFAVNVLFYTVSFGVLTLGPLSVRRLVRKRRNQCLACGYALGQSELCTECGKPVPKRAVA